MLKGFFLGEWILPLKYNPIMSIFWSFHCDGCCQLMCFQQCNSPALEWQGLLHDLASGLYLFTALPKGLPYCCLSCHVFDVVISPEGPGGICGFAIGPCLGLRPFLALAHFNLAGSLCLRSTVPGPWVFKPKLTSLLPKL